MQDDDVSDLKEHARKQAEFEQKVKAAKEKREKARQTGTQKDFQDAILADLDAIKAKLGI